MPFRLRSCWRNIVRSIPVMTMAALAGTILSLSGCTSEPPRPAKSGAERVTFAVTSYPLLAMTETMAGAAADVSLVTEGGSPSPDWKPTSAGIQAMQRATRILISGGDYEPWLQRVTIPRSRLVDTADGYYDQFVRIPDAVIHQHGPDGSHSHPGVVWATWLDPRLAMSQLERTRDVLLKVLPDQTAEVRGAADGMSEQLRQLDSRLEQLAASTAGKSITVLGDAPVYQYLVQRLGWELHYIHLPDHGPLSDADRESLTKAIAEHQPSLVLLRATLSGEQAALQGDSAVPFALVDLCETADAERSLVERLGQNLDAIAAALNQ